MSDAEYQKLINDAAQKISELAARRNEIDTEIAKLSQFVWATGNLLSEQAQKELYERWRPFLEHTNTIVKSLTESIRKVLNDCYPKSLTATNVRDQLRVQGFDFSSYTSDPLPSVSTTLRRLKEAGEIEFDEYEGVAIYRAKPPAQNLRPRLTFGQRLSGARKSSAFYGEYPPIEPPEKKK